MVVKRKSASALFLLLFTLCNIGAQQIDMAAAEAEDNFRWGVYAYHRSFYNEAIRSLEAAQSLQPRNLRIRFWLGKALYKSGYEEAAFNEWNSILATGSGNPLLAGHLQMLSLSRGVGPEITETERLVPSRTYDGDSDDYYQFKRPTSIRPKPDGSFYVVAFGSNEIVTINANGIVAGVLKGGLGLDALNHPFDVLRVDDGTLFITEYEGDRIRHCTPGGEKISVFGKKGRNDGEFLGPQYIAADSQGYLYITDWGNSRVSKFDQDGNFILSFGKAVTAGAANDGVLNGPTGIAVMDDLVYVSDKNKHRIAVFDGSGNFIRSLGAGELWGPEGLFPLGNKGFLVADSRWLDGKTRLLELIINREKFTPVPDLPEDLQRISCAAYDANHNLVVGDYNGNRVVVASPVSNFYTGYYVEIERIDATGFPEVIVDVNVTDRIGRPVYGLENRNFFLSESEGAISAQLMFRPVSQQEGTEIVLLIEKSEAMAGRRNLLSQALEDLIDIKGNTDFTVVQAAQQPALVSVSASGKMEIIGNATGGGYAANWDLAAGLRLSASRLLPSRNRRVIILFSSGRPGYQTLPGRSLLEVKQLLANNHIALHVINLDTGILPEELGYLSEETGGKSYSYYQPQGLLPVIKNLVTRRDPRYILQYQSGAFPDFGKKYIELNVEVIMNQVSGKDVLGYYAPLE